MRRNICGIGGDAKRSAKGINILRTSLLGIGSAVIIRQFTQMSDALTQVQNRLGLVTRDSQELAAVTRELFKVSNETRSSFEATAEVYARTALSARNLGITQRETLNFTKALNQAIILSGATAQEARNGMIQFSQGLASNRLAGDELRATLEQLPLVADVIAAHMNTTRGALRELASQGKITAKEMIEAFGPDTQKKLQQQFEKTTVTISQALTVLENKLVEFTGKLNDGTGLAGLLATAIQGLSNNFEFFGRVVLTGIVAGAILAVTAAISTMTAAIIANPIGALITALVVGTSALIAFSDQILVSSDGVTTLQDVFVGLAQEIGVVFSEISSVVGDAVGGILSSLGLLSSDGGTSFIDLLKAGARFADRFVGVFVGLGKAISKAFETPFDAVKGIFLGFINFIIRTINSVVKTLMILPKVIGKVLFAVFTRLKTALQALSQSITQALKGQTEEAGKFLDQATFQLKQVLKEGTVGAAATFQQEMKKVADVKVLKEVFNPYAGAAAKAGKDVAAAFMEGFNGTTGVQDMVNRVVVRAEGRSAQREVEEAKKGKVDLDKPVSGADGADRETLQDIAIKKQIDTLLRRNEVIQETLGLGVRERSVRTELLKIEEQLIRKGVEMTDAQREQIMVALEQNQAYQSQSEILERLTGGAATAAFEITQLNALFAAGRITVEQFSEELRNLRVQELSQSRDVLAGFERGFLNLQNTIGDFASQSEASLTNAFNSAEDALVQFVQTGEFNFSKLVDSILADITRLLARQALMGLLGAATGGTSGFAGTIGQFFMGGKAEGGPVQSGKTFLVGEEGPELFTPSSNGSISTADQTNAMLAMAGREQAPPQVNVQVVNVTDPSEAVSAMSSSEGQQVILNTIRKHKKTIKELG